MSTLAAKEMSRLSDQLENLTMRLLSSEKEKKALHKQLEESKQQAARLASSEKSETTQAGYTSRESDLQRLNQQLKSQLKDTEDALAKAVREAAESDKQQAVAREDLEVAIAEVSRNAAQRDELKRDLELIKSDNDKIRKVLLIFKSDPDRYPI
jgi:chromosome segregation ATPase